MSNPLLRPHLGASSDADLRRGFHATENPGERQAFAFALARRRLGIMGNLGSGLPEVKPPMEASGMDGMGQGPQGMAQGPHGAAQGAAMGSATGMQRAAAPGGGMAPGGPDLGLILKALAALLASASHPQPPAQGAAPPQAPPPGMPQ